MNAVESKIMNLFNKPALASLVFVVLCSMSADTARADTVTFDFEDQTIATERQAPLTLTRSGLSVTIARLNYQFNIADTSGLPLPNPLGTRSLSSSFTGESGGEFFVTFSQPVTGVSIDAAAFINDGTRTVSLTAYAGAPFLGPVVGSASASLPGDVGSFAVLPLSVTFAPGINSVSFVRGVASPAFSNQVTYFDNLTVTFTPQPIPEPTTLSLLGAGLAGAAVRARRRFKERSEQ